MDWGVLGLFRMRDVCLEQAIRVGGGDLKGSKALVEGWE